MIEDAEEAVRRFVSALHAAEVPYMITGSFASGYYAQGRSTQDVDFVIMPTPEQLSGLLAQFQSTEFYVDADTAFDALRNRAQFNAIDQQTFYKADFMIRKSRPFSEAEFDRRVPAVYAGVPVMIATAEDVVVSKLEWAKLGGSARQIEDVASILQVRAARIDRPYVEHWVEQLGLQAQWEAAGRMAGITAEG